MGAPVDPEIASSNPLPSSVATNAALSGAVKWGIIGSLAGVLGIVGIMVALHLAGILAPEKNETVKVALQTGSGFQPKTINSAANSIGAIKAAENVNTELKSTADVPVTPQTINSAASPLASMKSFNTIQSGAAIQSQATNNDAAIIGTALLASSDGVKDVVEDIGDGIKDVVDNIGDAVSNIGEGLFDGLSDLTEEIADGLSDGFGDMGDMFDLSSDDAGMLMMASVLGQGSSQPSPQVAPIRLDKSNPYNVMPVAQPPRSARASTTTNDDGTLGLALLAMGDGLDGLKLDLSLR